MFATADRTNRRSHLDIIDLFMEIHSPKAVQEIKITYVQCVEGGLSLLLTFLGVRKIGDRDSTAQHVHPSRFWAAG